MLTKEDFIKESLKIHGNKYIYDKCVIKRKIDKVEIICPNHGSFWQSPKQHLKGHGCKKCATEAQVKKRTFTNEDFIKRAREIHENKYDLSKVKYINNHTKVCIICPIHGEFWQRPANHLCGQGCPHCAGTNRKDTKQFIEDAKKIHGDKYDYSKVEYKGNKKNVCIICHKKDSNGKEHGEFFQQALTHLRGFGCPKCSNNYRRNTEEFIKDAKKVHNSEYDYSKTEYMNNDTKICIICHQKDVFGKEHGEFWQRPKNHLKGENCPKCQGKNITQEEIIYRCNLTHNGFYKYDNFVYKNYRTKACIICPIHGEFWQTAQIHLQGNGCPKCKQSHLEKEISNFLKTNNIEYTYQKRFDWLGLQSLDFYLPDYNIAIECQGEQHFRPVNFGSKTMTNEESFKLIQERDERKKCLCEEKGIKLLYYTDIDLNDKHICNYKCFRNKEKLLEEILYG